MLAGALPSASDPLAQRCIERLLGGTATGVGSVMNDLPVGDGRPAGPGAAICELVRVVDEGAARLGIMAGDVCAPLAAELSGLSDALDEDPAARGAVCVGIDDLPIWDRSLWRLPLRASRARSADGSPPLWRVLGAAGRHDRGGVAVTSNSSNTVASLAGDLDTPYDVANAVGIESLRLGVLLLGAEDSQLRLDRLRQTWAGHSITALDPDQLLRHLEGVQRAPVDVIGILPGGPRSGQIA